MPRTAQAGSASRKRVLITRRLLPGAAAYLRARGFEVEQGVEGPMPRRTLLRRAALADGLLSMLSDRVDAELLEACPRLKAVANYAVGYDNFDLAAADARGVLLTNTPEVLTDATAELAWALILACARRIPEGDRLTRSGRFRGWDPLLLLGTQLRGKRLLVVGPGRIGRAVAGIARGFGMRVTLAGRGRLPLEAADVVSLNVPLSPSTRHLIGRRELRRMKPTAILVNTARGPVVDEAALVEALRGRRILAAGLDVYEREPGLARGLARLPNAVLLPHLGSATLEARSAMGLRAARNLARALSGKRPRDLVNRPGRC